MTRTGENMAAVIKGRRGRTQFLTRWESFEDDSWVFLALVVSYFMITVFS